MFSFESSPLRVGAVGVLAVPALLVLVAQTATAAPRIVCIGEQTTKTAEMSPTWPVKMQTDLGAAYTATDDGDGNGSVLVGSKGGTHTFATAANAPYADSILAPDIVVIGPWAEHDEIAVKGGADATHFQADYDALVSDYLGLAKKPCVILTTPVIISTYQQNPDTDTLVTNTIEPPVVAVGAKYKLTVVDLYTTFMNQAAWLGGDGHFTADGAAKVAAMVEAVLPSCASSGGGGGSGCASSGGAAGASGAGGAGGGGGGVQSAGGAGAGGVAGSTGTGGVPASGGGMPSAAGALTGGTSSGSSAIPVSAGTASLGAGGSNGTAPSASSSEASGCALGSPRSADSRAAWLVFAAACVLVRRLRRAAHR